MPIPRFARIGQLPLGIHRATLEEIRARFGRGTARRAVLMQALEAMVRRAAMAGVQQILIDGSFVERVAEPRDVDVAVLLPADFEARLARREAAARHLERLIEAREGVGWVHAVAADDREQMDGWARYFGRSVWGEAKGVILLEIGT